MNNEEKLKEIFDKYRENKNSHVYLVETNSIDNAISDIKKLIININKDVDSTISTLVESDSLPTLTIVRPRLNEIVTEDIEKLLIKLHTIPNITKENYFIICESERLNKKSGNQMLKIIEEPESDIFGFFICYNVDSVMSTITSRTQFISLQYDISKNFSEELMDDANNFLSSIRNGGTILLNKYYVDKYKDIVQLSNFIDCVAHIQKKYIDTLKNFDIIKKENLLLKYIFDLQKKLYANCNITLLLDRFFIEASRL